MFNTTKGFSETLRLYKYDLCRDKTLYRNNIDFIKSNLKAEYLAKFADKLEEIIQKFPHICELSRCRHATISGSSFYSDEKDKNVIMVYAVKYYEGWNSERHLGFCFYYDNGVQFRIFRVDKNTGDSYSPKEEYNRHHRAVTISLRKLKYTHFVNAFIEMTYELIGLIEGEKTNFRHYPKYVDEDFLLKI